MKKERHFKSLYKRRAEELMKKDIPRLLPEQTVSQAINSIRTCCPSERIIYFYVVNEGGKLLGVVPTRRLLMSSEDTLIKDIMVKKMITVFEDTSLIELLEKFHEHRFLAIPVVDKAMKLKGVVDLGAVADDIQDLEDKRQADVVFESLGYELSQLKSASLLKVFFLRVKWLSTTVASGFFCAILTYIFVDTLLKDKTLTFFIALVLALGESVSTQTMTITLQALHNRKPNWRWFLNNLRKEIGGSLILGAFLGILVSALIFFWLSDLRGGMIVGSAVALSVITSSLIGLALPSLLHSLNFNYKVAASPAVLATADIFTLTTYFGIAALFI